MSKNKPNIFIARAFTWVWISREETCLADSKSKYVRQNFNAYIFENAINFITISVTRAKNPKSAAYLSKIATFIAPIFKVHFFHPNSRPTNKCLFFMQSLAILWHFITWIVWYSNHLPISLRKLDGIWKKKYFSKILK